MSAEKRRASGFTLIAVLLLMVLMSALAMGLMYMVNTEARVGGSDLENNLAYHAAEGGMEKMTADLATLYASSQAPTVANIVALGGSPPSITGVNYVDYSITVPTNPDGTPVSAVDTIKSGPNAGLIAEITPMTLSVTAQRPLGDQVHMLRTVEVAQIPVFQFGVFSDSDLSYFPGPNFAFAGRVHTNGNLFLASGSSLTFKDKLSAVGEVIRARLSNGWDTATNYTGSVYIPNAPAGCNAGGPAANCIPLGYAQGSKVTDPNSANNPAWSGISTGTYNGWIINHSTGATPLTLPFVGGGATPVQIIRRPAPGELPGSTLATSRLYNQAQIRVMLSDNPLENHYDGKPVDADDVELASKVPATLLPSGSGWAQNGVTVSGVAGTAYFGEARTATDADFVLPPNFHGAAMPGGTTEWPQVDGYLRVEVRYADGTWHPVTREWLGLGFARPLQPPDSSAGRPNSIHPKAILMFQEPADRNGNGVLDGTDPVTFTGINTQYNWFPINFYDPREGEARDTDLGNGTCTPNGLMNAVELDVRNLRDWLAGTIPGTGNQVDWAVMNGYILYFSDRRGMMPDKNVLPNTKVGEYGFEDVVNAASSVGTPDGALEPNNPGTVQSPEDVDQNAKLDIWGAWNVGEAFGAATTAATHSLVSPNPFTPRIGTCVRTGRKNAVTGARHVLKLVDGTRGNLPTRPDGKGGFTVGSETPVYIQGDYNASAADNAWADPHSAAAVIADAVTLLSNGWSDLNSTINTTIPGNRAANQTWYRLAIAGGKNIPFPRPGTWASSQDFGTDGGVHNFLRYIESWGQPLHYQGSLVSLYYSQYATGIFKCCTTVYSPPTRDYSFDVLFLDPANLPPGTPMFRDVDNVNYRQDFTPY